MVAASLIVAALIGLPFSPRTVVPVASSDLAVTATPAVFDPAAVTRAHATTIRVTPAVDGVLAVTVESQTGAVVATLADGIAARAGRARTLTWDGAGAADGRRRASVTRGAVRSIVTGVTASALPPASRRRAAWMP